MNLAEIKRLLEEKQAEKDRTTGKLETLMDQLKNLGYNSDADGKKAQKKIEGQVRSLKKEYTVLMDRFKKKFMDKLV